MIVACVCLQLRVCGVASFSLVCVKSPYASPGLYEARPFLVYELITLRDTCLPGGKGWTFVVHFQCWQGGNLLHRHAMRPKSPASFS